MHKLLTGRQRDFDGLRQAGGVSGYPSRTESPHDVIENSHASTALSYADGLAKAFALRGARPPGGRGGRRRRADRRHVLGGAEQPRRGAPDRPVVVVLNDNGRSYAPTVGGLADHLALLRARTDRGEPVHRAGFRLPRPGRRARHRRAGTASWPRPRRWAGRWSCTASPSRARATRPPRRTTRTACTRSARPRLRAGGRSWTSVFADSIVEIGATRPDVVCLTAAMLLPAGLGPFAARFPERTFDVGIAEQHAVTSAAGLAMGGLHPVVAIYATFLSRAFDQVLMDVALHRLGVTFVLDRAGVTGPDGAEPPRHVGRVGAAGGAGAAAGGAPRSRVARGAAARRGVDRGRADRAALPEGVGRAGHPRGAPGRRVRRAARGAGRAGAAGGGRPAGRRVPRRGGRAGAPRRAGHRRRSTVDDAAALRAACGSRRSTGWCWRSRTPRRPARSAAGWRRHSRRPANRRARRRSRCRPRSCRTPPAREILRAHGLDASGIAATVLKRLARMRAGWRDDGRRSRHARGAAAAATVPAGAGRRRCRSAATRRSRCSR